MASDSSWVGFHSSFSIFADYSTQATTTPTTTLATMDNMTYHSIDSEPTTLAAALEALRYLRRENAILTDEIESNRSAAAHARSQLHREINALAWRLQQSQSSERLLTMEVERLEATLADRDATAAAINEPTNNTIITPDINPTTTTSTATQTEPTALLVEPATTSGSSSSSANIDAIESVTEASNASPQAADDTTIPSAIDHNATVEQLMDGHLCDNHEAVEMSNEAEPYEPQQELSTEQAAPILTSPEQSELLVLPAEETSLSSVPTAPQRAPAPSSSGAPVQQPSPRLPRLKRGTVRVNHGLNYKKDMPPRYMEVKDSVGSRQRQEEVAKKRSKTTTRTVRQWV
jgi:hypothetical protein